MKYKQIRDAFLEVSRKTVADESFRPFLINPELIQIGTQKFVFLVENESMDDEQEVERLLRQSQIEEFGFIIVFTDKSKLIGLANLLVSELVRMHTEDETLPLYFLEFHESTKDFSYLNYSIQEEAEVTHV